MKKENKPNYFLIPMKYRSGNRDQMKSYNFNDMKKELESLDKHGIAWGINCKAEESIDSETKKASYKLKGFYAKHIKKDDIIYFYVTNLPTQSGHSPKSRILLRGVVTEMPHAMRRRDIYVSTFQDLSKGYDPQAINPDKDPDEMIGGIRIGEIRVLREEVFKKDNFFSREHIIDKYKQDPHKGIPQGKN